ncbi:hypothetical protein HIDPHFAB_03196 [Nocardioides sp. T2.26MG-1]|nr:hypothetical protein HIDPHFAB_03196 [Nocardioides sp. T2.26MG-1]
MKRLVLIVLGGYLLVAVGNKVAEAAGMMTCGCADDCWCKRPGLSPFRWVFPWRHRGPHTAQEKATLEHAQA